MPSLATNTVEGVAMRSNQSMPGNGTVVEGRKSQYEFGLVKLDTSSSVKMYRQDSVQYKFKRCLPTKSSVEVVVIIVSFFSHHAAHAARVKKETTSSNVRRADRCIVICSVVSLLPATVKFARQGQ